MSSSSLDPNANPSANSLAVILSTTLSALNSYAPRVRESSSLRDLERALICALADLKRADATEGDRAVHGTFAN